jgi:hypothetical protein
MHRRRAVVLLAGFFAGLGAGAPTALAQDWEAFRAEFRKGLRDPDWKERRDWFARIQSHDRAEAVAEILTAVEREENAAVVLGAVEALGALRSTGAREARLERARRGKPGEQLLALLALGGTGADAGAVPVLLEVARAGSPAARAQAALALGRLRPAEARDALEALLSQKDWQVRVAAARGLRDLGDRRALPALAGALAAEKGRPRADLLQALAALAEADLGYDPAAWTKVAAGADPASVKAAPRKVASLFGIPLYGEQVVVVLDNSLRMGDPHPFRDAERLIELCTPPEGGTIAWFRVKTIQQLAQAQLRHWLQNAQGVRFELIVYNQLVRSVFGRLTPLGAASRKAATETIEGLFPEHGINAYGALAQALDAGGAGDARAWRAGPDEIVFVGASQPNAGEITEPDVIAAAIALRARLRMVTVHMVGIHTHPYEMYAKIAEGTGGVYANWTR